VIGVLSPIGLFHKVKQGWLSLKNKLQAKADFVSWFLPFYGGPGFFMNRFRLICGCHKTRDRFVAPINSAGLPIICRAGATNPGTDLWCQ